MGRSAIDVPSTTSEVLTVVLVGRTGNGKSATGNSILGRRAFKSASSSAGVTSTCNLQTGLADGKTLKVIDTPGLFDFSAEPQFAGKEIAKCVSMAEDGIHAVLVILSVRSRFSREEAAAIERLQKIFGAKITDYMIVVFTGGDDLEDSEETLDDYLGRDCPEPLKKILEMCGNRRVLFDNKTKDKSKKSEQLKELLSVVDDVVRNNGGKPYTDEPFVELEASSNQEISELKQWYEEQLKRQTEMVELKLRETTSRLQQQVAEEQVARLKAEALAQSTQMKSNDEIRKLKEEVEETQREIKKPPRQEEEKSSGCAIL